MSKNKHHFSGGAWHTQIVVQVMIQNFFFLCVCVVCVWGGSLSPPRLNIFTVGNMGAMIYLGQGFLHSLSASNFFILLFKKSNFIAPHS